MRNNGSTSRLLALLVAISAVGILLRFAAINRSYWLDELATVNTVDVADWQTVLQNTATDNQPPLYNSMVFGPVVKGPRRRRSGCRLQRRRRDHWPPPVG
jgi:hypothetical protein